MKKVLIITGSILLIIAIAVGLYFFFKKSGVGSGTNTNGNFPTTDGTTLPSDNTGGDNTPSSSFDTTARLRQVSNKAIAGYTLYETASSTIARYQEKGTGYVYDTDLYSGNTTQITFTTIPGTYASFFVSPTQTLTQTVDDTQNISTFIGTITNTSSKGGLDLKLIEKNVADIVIDRTNNQAFLIVKTEDGSDWYVMNNKGMLSLVYNTNLSAFHAEWIDNSHILLYTKPDSTATGAAFIFNTKTKQLSLTLTGINGLTAYTTNTAYVLVSGVKDNMYRSWVYNTKTGTSSPMYQYVITDKCAQELIGSDIFVCAINELQDSASKDSLTSWYQGGSGHADTLGRIYLPTGSSYGFADINPQQNPLDMIKLQTSDSGLLYTFINKPDSHLWVYDNK